MSAKIDLSKLGDYAAPKKPVLLDIKPAQYFTITGQGEPGKERFTAAIGALYAMAFTVKMTWKFAGKEDYAVCKLECQWPDDLANTPRAKWRWKMMIRTPEFITDSERATAVEKLIGKGKPPEVKEVKLETLSEGQCVQMLHVGPYDKEGETTDIMRRFAEGKGQALAGPPHEIYLSDPRRVAPEKLKTILRRPVVRS